MKIKEYVETEGEGKTHSAHNLSGSFFVEHPNATWCTQIVTHAHVVIVCMQYTKSFV